MGRLGMSDEEIADEIVNWLDESQLLIPFSRTRSFEETRNQAKILILAAIKRANKTETAKVYKELDRE